MRGHVGMGIYGPTHPPNGVRKWADGRVCASGSVCQDGPVCQEGPAGVQMSLDSRLLGNGNSPPAHAEVTLTLENDERILTLTRLRL